MKRFSYFGRLLGDFRQRFDKVALLTDSLSSVNALQWLITARGKHLAIPMRFGKHFTKQIPMEIHHLPRDFKFVDDLVKQSSQVSKHESREYPSNETGVATRQNSSLRCRDGAS